MTIKRVAEIDGAALAVGQPAVVEHLQQHVEDVRMRLFDLVEQHDLIGPPPHRFGERAAFVVTDIAGRRADQPRHRMLLHVFRHVDADERVLVVEQKLRQRLGQLGLADARGPEEHERADRPVRILQAGARPAHRGRHRLARLRPGRPRACRSASSILQQLFALAFEHAVDRNAGPARHHLRDVVGGHRFFGQRSGAGGRALALFQLALRAAAARCTAIRRRADNRRGGWRRRDRSWPCRAASAIRRPTTACPSRTSISPSARRPFPASAARSFSSRLSRSLDAGSLSFFSASCSILQPHDFAVEIVELFGLGNRSACAAAPPPRRPDRSPCRAGSGR